MDSGKYVDMAVQNPHGIEMIRLIFLPRNFNIFLGEIERFMPSVKSQGFKKNVGAKTEVDWSEMKTEEYALKVLYEMIWAFGVLRLPLSNKSYWKKHLLSSTRSPWGEVPMEIYIVDHFLDDVIRPQCPW